MKNQSTNGWVYLSGGMQYALNLGAKWREVCGERLTALGYDPINITELDVAYTEAHGSVTDIAYKTGVTDNELQIKSNIRHQFITTDLLLIRNNTDLVVAYYDESFRQGSGSFSECQCAYDNEKPLFIVSEFQHIPSWLKSLATKTFHHPLGSDYAFEELYKYLGELPLGILKTDCYGNHHSGSQYLCSLCGSVFEKSKHHFVSKISPLYCKSCVDIVKETRERHADRYEFVVSQLYKE